MKLLLDESVPRRLARSFPESFAVRTVQDMGWAGTPNGLLLSLAAAEGFDALVTVDRGIEHQQNVNELPIPVIVMDPGHRHAGLPQSLGRATAACLRGDETALGPLGKPNLPCARLNRGHGVGATHQSRELSTRCTNDISRGSSTGLPRLRSIALDGLVPGLSIERFPVAVNLSSVRDIPRTPHVVTEAQVRQAFVASGTCHAIDRRAVCSHVPCAVEGSYGFRPQGSPLCQHR